MDLAVIALSARPLAASAARAGLSALALDLFADLDTCAHAARCVRVHKKGSLAFDGEDLIQALASLSPPGLPVVLGGGFEHDTALMQRIGERNPILGNMAETVRLLKDPLALAALCGHLRIPFPAVSLEAPAGDLLAGPMVEKQIGGLGGAHVRLRAAGDAAPPPPGRYVQARVEGDTHSLVLLSNGTDIRVVGAVRQWTAPGAGLPFRYGGAVGPVTLPGAHGPAILAAAQRIATVCGLVGLVSFDVVVGPSGWWLLEVNPRPGSSLEILDVEPLPPLLALHLAACGGKLPPATLPAQRDVTATALLYADTDVMVPPGDWPDWLRDRMAAGTVIPAGVPVCTVTARAARPEAARQAVETRLAEVRDRLGLPPAGA